MAKRSGRSTTMATDEEILSELRSIRKLLEPKPAPPPPKGLVAEFRDFLSKYKVMGLAVAFILGLYLGTLVQALVSDLIMPIIQFVTPGMAWETIELGPFRIGHFVGTLITFIIIAFVIFLLVKMTKRWGVE
ncbi:MAG TPA: MscL family protein [Candidatus Methanomethylicus sp.]|nr:MscL family protein [Candidatus Methanomethylicus sp.]